NQRSGRSAGNRRTDACAGVGFVNNHPANTAAAIILWAIDGMAVVDARNKFYANHFYIALRFDFLNRILQRRDWRWKGHTGLSRTRWRSARGGRTGRGLSRSAN